MFCLKCGIETGDDQEFCVAHASDPVTENSVKAQLEEQESQERSGNTVRCPACNQLVYEEETNCPSCGAHMPVTNRG